MTLDQLDAIAAAATPTTVVVPATRPSQGHPNARGPKFHAPTEPGAIRSDCRALTGDGQAIPIAVARREFEACSLCNPGDPR